MNEIVIECRDLSYGYSKNMIYNKFNLKITKGKVVGLLGKNGVGKSTLINLIMGYLKPMSGECLIYGTPVNRLNDKQKAKIGLLHEGFITYDYLSISQIYHLFKYYYKNFDIEIFNNFIKKLNVNLNQKINTLSYGQKSQVVLALIMAQNPEILILDDYSLGLDAGYRSLFLEYLKNYIKMGDKTVFLTTHIVSNLDSLLDEIVIVDRKTAPLILNLDDFKHKFHGYVVDTKFNCSDLKITSIFEIDKNHKKIYGFFKLDDKEELNLDFEEMFLGLVGRY